MKTKSTKTNESLQNAKCRTKIPTSWTKIDEWGDFNDGFNTGDADFEENSPFLAISQRKLTSRRQRVTSLILGRKGEQEDEEQEMHPKHPSQVHEAACWRLVHPLLNATRVVAVRSVPSTTQCTWLACLTFNRNAEKMLGLFKILINYQHLQFLKNQKGPFSIN